MLVSPANRDKATIAVDDITELRCVAASGKPGYVCSYGVGLIAIVEGETMRSNISLFEARFLNRGRDWDLVEFMNARK